MSETNVDTPSTSKENILNTIEAEDPGTASFSEFYSEVLNTERYLSKIAGLCVKDL